MNLTNVLEIIDEDDSNKGDYTTQVSNLHADPQSGRIEFIQSKLVTGHSRCDVQFDLTAWAEFQLLTRLKMPVAYFQKVKKESPDNYARHFNYWAERDTDPVLIRARDLGDKGLIRGVVSDRYSVLDNNTTSDIIRQALTRIDDDYEVNQFNLSENRFHLRVTYPNTDRSLGLLSDGLPGGPDVNRVGTDFVNSEVGYSSFTVGLMLWRLVCTNGLHGWAREDFITHRHVGIDAQVMRGRISEMVGRHIHNADEYLSMYENTQSITIMHPLVVISRLALEHKLTNAFTDLAKERWEGDATAYGVINSLSNAAKDMSDTVRFDIEAIAGALITLPAYKWSALDVEE